MGAGGMISFIAFAVLLFPLAAALMNEERVEQLFVDCGAEFTHSVEAQQDLQSSGIDQHIRRRNAVPIRRKLAEVNCEPRCGKKHDHLFLEKDIESIPFTVSKADTGGGGIDNTTIIIVVASTAAVTFLLATLLFCWYTRTYGGVQNDEKPLLSLSSSQKPSYTVQNSVKDPGNTGDHMLGVSSHLQKKDSSVNSSVSLGIPLEPPPGILSASGIPPLKPPPGRPDLALKTPPGRTDLSVHCPPVNTHSPPNRSPVDAAPPARAPSARRVPSARRPPSAAPPPPPPPSGKAPPPPPPMKKGPAPPPPPAGGRPPPRPPGAGFKFSRPSSEPSDPDGDDSNKAKLKPFFWDKVNMANPDQAMVWSQIRAGSFQFNEEMIENLFGYNATEKNKGSNKKSSSQDTSSNLVQIIDPKKAQNLSILLKALNVTTNEVCDALKDGNELPVELIQTLLKMAPTGEEELKLRLYNGDISRLGTAERFLKRIVEIPFAFKRLESLLFMCTLQEEEEIMKESFQTLEAACIQLKKSRLFLKLLEAVLKTGNRMNDGTFRGSAQAFKLDTLLKLSDVKGVDGKTTLLHFVVLEIIRAEGVRAAKTAHDTKRFSSFSSDELLEESANNSQDSDEYYRNLGLQVVSSLSSELDDVKKAAILDAEGLTGTVSKFGHALIKAREFLNTELKNINQEKGDGDDDEDEDEFAVILSNFVQDAEKDVMWMLEEEKRIMALVKDTADYFHGQAGKDEGLRLFVIVRDFLIILDKVCKEIKNNPLVRPIKMTGKKDGSPSKQTEKKDISSSETKDDSEPRITQTEEVSEPRQTQTTDISSPRTHETHETETPYKMQETDDSSIQKTDDSKREIRKDDDLHPRTEEDGASQHKSQETDDSKHETNEDNDLQPMTEEDGASQHKAHETDDLKHGTREDNDLQPRIEEDGASQHKSQKTDNSKHETRDDYDLQLRTQEYGASQHKTQETDDPKHAANDLQSRVEENAASEHKTLETDDSKHETREDNDLQPRTEEDGALQHKTHETNDLQPESREKNVDETSGKASEANKASSRVPHERLIPAIAMRRVDTFSSSSSSDED